MYTDDTRPTPDHHDFAHKSEPRETVFARVRAVAHDIAERVRKALGGDDDTRPPGFNGAMLVA